MRAEIEQAIATDKLVVICPEVVGTTVEILLQQVLLILNAHLGDAIPLLAGVRVLIIAPCFMDTFNFDVAIDIHPVEAAEKRHHSVGHHSVEAAKDDEPSTKTMKPSTHDVLQRDAVAALKGRPCAAFVIDVDVVKDTNMRCVACNTSLKCTGRDYNHLGHLKKVHAMDWDYKDTKGCAEALRHLLERKQTTMARFFSTP